MTQEIVIRDEKGKLRVQQQQEIQKAVAIVALDLMEEMADRLARLQELEENQLSKGEERGWEVAVTDSVQEIEVRDPVTKKKVYAHTASLFNDGDDDVYVCINYPHTPGQLKLKKGDTQNIDYSRSERKLEYFYAWCPTKGGTAILRIHIRY